MKRLFLILLLLLTFSASALAEEFTFVPGGILKLDLISESYSGQGIFTSGSGTETYGEYLTRRYSGLPKNQPLFEGDISESGSFQKVRLVYGVNADWNLILQVGTGSKTRTGDLTGANGPRSQTFAAREGAQSISGMLDSLLGFNYRISYTDDHDFQLSALYHHDDGESAHPREKALTLGQGSGGMLFRFTWDYYLSKKKAFWRIEGRAASNWMAQHQNDQGETMEYLHGIERSALLRYNRVAGNLSWGLGALKEEKRDSRVNRGDLHYSDHDNYQRTSLVLGASYGNLGELEQGPLALPWEINAEYRYAYRGLNALKANQLTLGANLYF